MFVAPVTETELIQVISSIKNSLSVGFDETRTLVVKQCLCHFIKPLVHIYSDSFQTGAFPDIMKKAKINLKKGINRTYKITEQYLYYQCFLNLKKINV